MNSTTQQQWTEPWWTASTYPRGMVDSVLGWVSDRKLRLFALARTPLICEDQDLADLLDQLLAAIDANDKRSIASIRKQAKRIDEHATESARYDPVHADHWSQVRRTAYQIGLLSREAAWTIALYRLANHSLSDADLRHPIREAREANLLREIVGNPYRPIEWDDSWRTADVMSIALSIYRAGDYAVMPILADALEEAGCTEADILDHLRSSASHVRGCWALDKILGLE